MAVIPARSGSKGISNKNLQLLGGRTLLEWAIGASLKTPQIHRTIVSTDSLEYAQYAMSFGAEAPFLRPPEHSLDQSGDLEFVLHLLDFLQNEEKSKVPDLIVHLRPTTPMRKPRVLEKAINETTEVRSALTAVRSVHKMSESAYKCFERDSSGKLLTVFSQNQDIEASNAGRQNFPSTYVGNGYVDILIPGEIMKTRKLHGDKVHAFETENVIEVDSIEDLELLRAIDARDSSHRVNIFGIEET